MWGDIFMSAGKQLGSFIYARKQAESDRKWRDYNNAMVNLQNGQNQNALTVNALLAKRRFTQTALQIQKSGYATQASVELSAASTGTVGRSVNMQLFDVSRTTNEAHNRNRQELDDTFLEIDNKRQQSAMGAQTNLDLRSLPGPNPLTHMLGFAGDVLSNKEFRERYTNGRTGTPQGGR